MDRIHLSHLTTLPLVVVPLIVMPGSRSLPLTLHHQLSGGDTSGQSRLAAMLRATSRQGSVHEVIVSAISHQAPVRVTVDVSWRARASRSYGLGWYLAGASHQQGTEMLRVGNRLAQRQLPRGQWECSRDPGPYFPVYVIGKLTFTKLETVRNEEVTTLRRVRVWHVRARGAEKQNGSSRQVTVDYYISTQTHRLLRQVLLQIWSSPQKLTSRSTMDFSQYGEPVTVAMPPTCRT